MSHQRDDQQAIFPCEIQDLILQRAELAPAVRLTCKRYSEYHEDWEQFMDSLVMAPVRASWLNVRVLRDHLSWTKRDLRGLYYVVMQCTSNLRLHAMFLRASDDPLGDWQSLIRTVMLKYKYANRDIEFAVVELLPRTPILRNHIALSALHRYMHKDPYLSTSEFSVVFLYRDRRIRGIIHDRFSEFGFRILHYFERYCECAEMSLHDFLYEDIFWRDKIIKWCKRCVRGCCDDMKAILSNHPKIVIHWGSAF